MNDNTRVRQSQKGTGEALARRVVESLKVLSVKLKDLENDIRALWVEFDRLKDGETILGCRTRAEFCEQYLNRTPRAVQYMLGGGNHNRCETVSPVPIKCSRCDETLLSRTELRNHGRNAHAITDQNETAFVRETEGAVFGYPPPPREVIVVPQPSFPKMPKRDSVLARGEHSSITLKNIEDTRCLSMMQFRLIFCRERIKLLLRLQNSRETDEDVRCRVQEVLKTYRQAFQDFENFASEDVEFIDKHSSKVKTGKR